MSELGLLALESPVEDVVRAGTNPDKEQVPLLDRPAGPSRPWGRIAALAGTAALLTAVAAAAMALPSALHWSTRGTARGAVDLTVVAPKGSAPWDAKAPEAASERHTKLNNPRLRTKDEAKPAHRPPHREDAAVQAASARHSKFNNPRLRAKDEAKPAPRRPHHEDAAPQAPSVRHAKLNSTKLRRKDGAKPAPRRPHHEDADVALQAASVRHTKFNNTKLRRKDGAKPAPRRPHHEDSDAAPQAYDASKVNLTLLPTETGARCLDGSPAGFYLDRARDKASRTKWVFILEGGAKCFDAEFCHEALSSSRGTSTHFQPNLAGLVDVFLVDGNLESNPHFGTWNRVFVPYCSQDSWSGTRTDKSEETFGFYFSGHIIIQVLVQHLKAQEGLGAATELVFGGYSAGGTGSWLNARYVADQLPSLQRMVHLPIAGFFLPDIHWTWQDANMILMTRLWHSYMDPNCTANNAGAEHRCILSSYSARFSPWRKFVVQAETDCVQMGCSEFLPFGAEGGCQAPQAENFRTALMQELQAGLKPTDGYFLAACIMHHKFGVVGPRIVDPAAQRQVNYVEALWDFYNGRDVRLADTCGTACGDCAR